MSEIRIARRYAKALMDLAVEHHVLDSISEDMRLIEMTCRENRPLVVALANPIIHASQKAAIVKKIFGGKLQQITEKFLALLCSKHRVLFLFEISTEFRQAYNEFKGIEIATVATPVELDVQMRNQFMDIVRKISGKSQVELNEKIDTSLIGGFVLTVRDRQIDDSIKSRLRQMRTHLTFA